MSATALVQLSAWLVICVVALAAFGYGSVVGQRRALERVRAARTDDRAHRGEPST